MDGIETSQILAFENQGNNYIQNMRLPIFGEELLKYKLRVI